MLRKTGLLLTLSLLLAAGCSEYEPFDSAAHLRALYAQRVGPQAAAHIEVPFELSPEISAEIAARLRPLPSARREVTQVVDFIFDRLDLRYELAPTRSAVETFSTQRGNCLSFVNLFVGVVRERGLAPFYVEVTDHQKWSSREGMVVSQGHIVAGMYLDGELETYDFLPYRPKSYKAFQPIDDLTAAAHYYNNLGAEALLAGELERARRFLTIATGIAPGFDKALNNLGVLLARTGEPERALEAYQRGLAIAPDSPSILTNMVRLYQELGRADEAQRLAARVETANATNPFFFVYEADLALSRGEPGKALEYMARALRQDSELPEIHLGLVRIYLAMGEVEKARHHLARALKLDATNREALQYARMLGK